MLTFLGDGGAFNVEKGNTSAFYKDNEKFILFDCGEDVFKKLIENAVLRDVKGKQSYVFITHFHGDHIGSLSTLCHYYKNILKDSKNFKVVYPDKERIQTFLEFMGVDKKDLIIKTPKELKEELPSEAVQQNHIEGSFGYFVNIGNKNIFYSGDTASVHPKAIDLLERGELDYLYQEVSNIDIPVHTHINNMCDDIAPQYREKVYCMHFLNNETVTQIEKEGFNKVVTLSEKENEFQI